MRVLIDMNLTPLWVQALEAEGWEAVHWSNVGEPIATDREIMEWASSHGYIVFTHDLDFSALIAATQASAPSVVQVRTQIPLPSEIGSTVIEVLHRYRSELESGAIISVDQDSARVRLLPFKT